MNSSFVNKVFSVNESGFQNLAHEAFHFQLQNNPVYCAFCNSLPQKHQITAGINYPFLPIGFFKTHKVITAYSEPAIIFESSGTTGQQQSRHYVADTGIYEKSFTLGFEHRYGNPTQWCFIGLLPSYLERRGSSLVFMVNRLMQLSNHTGNGFYLQNFEELFRTLETLEKTHQKTMLFGVTYALLDFAEQYSLNFEHTFIMETGGMKGRRQELIREEVHSVLQKSFGIHQIHSEYGMTELLSQAYSKGDGLFKCPPWMKVLIRDEDDPFHIQTKGKGALNIIDLANIYSCSFIATDDVGEVFEDGSFKVLGRMDNSDIRGCSLLSL